MLKLVFQVILIFLVIRNIKLTSLKSASDQHINHGPLNNKFLREIICVNKSTIYYPSSVEQQQIVKFHNNVRQSKTKYQQRALEYNKKLELLLACQLSRCSSGVDPCREFQNVVCHQNLRYYDLLYFGEVSYYKVAFKNWINANSSINRKSKNSSNDSLLRLIKNRITYLGCGLIKKPRSTIIACTYCPKNTPGNLSIYKRQIAQSDDESAIFVEPQYRKQHLYNQEHDTKHQFNNMTWLNPHLIQYSNDGKNQEIGYTNENHDSERDHKWIGRRQFAEDQDMNTMDDDFGGFSGSESVQQTDVEFVKIVLCVHALFIIILF